MDFKADHHSINKFGEKLDSLVGDANKAVGYAEDWLSFGYSEGRMYVTAVNAAEEAKTALAENYKRLAAIQRTAAAEVDKAAQLYQRLDREEAERLDRTYDSAS